MYIFIPFHPFSSTFIHFHPLSPAFTHGVCFRSWLYGIEWFWTGIAQFAKLCFLEKVPKFSIWFYGNDRFTPFPVFDKSWLFSSKVMANAVADAQVSSDGMICSIAMLFTMLCLVFTSILVAGWKMTKSTSSFQFSCFEFPSILIDDEPKCHYQSQLQFSFTIIEDQEVEEM